MTIQGFRAMLKTRQEKIDSLACVGLDPDPRKMPEGLKSGPREEQIAEDVAYWMQRIVDATAPYASMFKPQRAHWEAMVGGEFALRSVIAYIHKHHPDIPVFLDCKRGDIGKTQARYAEALWGLDRADGANFSPYMGNDCMKALIHSDYPGKGIVGLCYTSNEAARQIQNIRVEHSIATRLWEFVALQTMEWADEFGIIDDAGLVMAAAYRPDKEKEAVFSEHLEIARDLVGDYLWFLIPGIGAQGGEVEQTVKNSFAGYGSIAINSSSGICMASIGDDYEEAAAKAAKNLRNEIRQHMP
jgi:orotidine-5'-phosphate decarboxylase